MSGVGRASFVGGFLLLKGYLRLCEPLMGVEGSFLWVFYRSYGGTKSLGMLDVGILGVLAALPLYILLDGGCLLFTPPPPLGSRIIGCIVCL